MSSNELVEAGGLRPQDFESIRDAVLETPRGRWFLSEYANRLRSSETIGIIDSMKRLEIAVSTNHDALMSRLAGALAREATVPGTSGPQADLAPKHMKFFKQDEEIFQPAPQARIAAVPDMPKPEAKPEVPKGARVVIRRSTDSAETGTSTKPVETPISARTAAPEAEPLEEAPKFNTIPSSESLPSPFAQAEPMPPPAVELEAAPKRRIVIIRHKPGEQIDVPLQNEMSATG